MESVTSQLNPALCNTLVASDKDLVKFGVTGKVLEVLDEAGIPYEVFSDIIKIKNIQPFG